MWPIHLISVLEPDTGISDSDHERVPHKKPAPRWNSSRPVPLVELCGPKTCPSAYFEGMVFDHYVYLKVSDPDRFPDITAA